MDDRREARNWIGNYIGCALDHDVVRDYIISISLDMSILNGRWWIKRREFGSIVAYKNTKVLRRRN